MPDLLYLHFPSLQMGLTGNRTAGKPGFKIGSSEEQQPIYYWPVTWHPRGAFHLGDCNRSPRASQSAHLLNAHAAKGRGKIPQLSCQSSNCISAKAVGKFSKPLKLYLGLQQYVFLLNIFLLACSSQAPTQNDNKGAQRGECRTGASLSQPGRSDEWTL